MSQIVESEASRAATEMVTARMAKLGGVSRLPVTDQALALGES